MIQIKNPIDNDFFDVNVFCHDMPDYPDRP